MLLFVWCLIQSVLRSQSNKVCDSQTALFEYAVENRQIFLACYSLGVIFTFFFSYDALLLKDGLKSYKQFLNKFGRGNEGSIV